MRGVRQQPGVRRVVAGDDERRPVVVRDGGVDAIELETFPGAAFFHLWDGSTRNPLEAPTASPVGRWIPEPGAFRFGVSILPPTYGAGAGLDLDEIRRKLPGLAETLDPDEPGMHTTDTLDLVYVASGRVVLDLGDEERVLEAGDTVVQRGNRHAWRNDGAEPCVLVITMLGTDPRPPAGGPR
jgi:mannose-6-phosphate isomerase-like protein (cupin superfamily)